MAGREVYEFGEFILDVAERRLSKGGAPVPLEPKAYEVLLALVCNAGRLLSKHQLLDLVWPESFVEEGILAVHVSVLRKTLGPGRHRYIETVSGGVIASALYNEPTGLRRQRRVSITFRKVKDATVVREPRPVSSTDRRKRAVATARDQSRLVD
jgi:hypothetical protein